MRLEKFLALAGVDSRRGAKALVLEGRVSVNDEIVAEPGHAVDESRDVVRVDDRKIRYTRKLVYLVLNKPAGYLTTVRDPQGRKTIYDLLPKSDERIVPVGRLDADTEGLLLLTNDGDLAFRLLHPRYKVPKTYQATVRGAPEEDALNRLRKGVFVEGRRTAPAQVTVVHSGEDDARLRLVIHEGRKRQVREMLRAVGHPVKKLRRIQFGPLSLAKLPKGGFREVSASELRELRRAAGIETSAPEPKAARADETKPAEPRRRHSESPTTFPTNVAERRGSRRRSTPRLSDPKPRFRDGNR